MFSALFEWRALYPSHTELRLTATSNRRWSPYVAAWSPLSRSLAITPKHSSQRIAVFLHFTRNANRLIVLRLYSEYTVTVQRFKETDCDRVRSSLRSLIVAVRSFERRPTADRVYCDRKVAARNSEQFKIPQWPYGDQCDRPRPHCDRTAWDLTVRWEPCLLRSSAIWSKNWSQYGRSLGVTGVWRQTTAGCRWKAF